jgi:hypothetical protein
MSRLLCLTELLRRMTTARCQENRFEAAIVPRPPAILRDGDDTAYRESRAARSPACYLSPDDPGTGPVAGQLQEAIWPPVTVTVTAAVTASRHTV